MTFFYGLSVGLYEVFPYQFLDSAKEVIFADNLHSQEDISNKIAISSIIDINNESDILKKREALNHLIWKTESLPNSYPDKIEKNILDERFTDLNNLKQIDRFSIEMKHGLLSYVYLFLPEKSNNQLIIYHQGHSGGFINGISTINYFLNNGYSVMAFSMPLVGMNNQPIIDVENIGSVKFFEHDQFKFLESENFSPLNYFFTPITLSLNYLDLNYNFKNYHMIGISGGGWTTTIYPALDTRISKSFAVSGSLPIPLRINPQDIGDYEQLVPDFYSIANYLEFYVMSSYGPNREFVQIFNKFDPCCFSGTLFENYQDEIQNKLSELNSGKFDVILDDTHSEHKISEKSLELILKKIQ